MSIYAASAPLKSMTTHGLHALSGRLMCRIGDYRKMLPDWPALADSLTLDLDNINAELARRERQVNQMSAVCAMSEPK